LVTTTVVRIIARIITLVSIKAKAKLLRLSIIIEIKTRFRLTEILVTPP